MSVTETEVQEVKTKKMFVCSDNMAFENEWTARDHEYELALARLFPGREEAVKAASKKIYSRFTRNRDFILALDAELTTAMG